MAGNDQVDQDAIAAQWEASLDSGDPAEAAGSGCDNELSETMALQWAAMVEDGSAISTTRPAASPSAVAGGNRQSCSASASAASISTIIPAFAPSSTPRWCPTSDLPMLEIVFGRLVQLMTTSLRNFRLGQRRVLAHDRITSVRFVTT